MSHLSDAIIIIILLISSLTVRETWCRSDGAPEEACKSMTPSHDSHLGLKTPPNVELVVNETEVKSGQAVQLMLRSLPGHSFKGFVLQARNEDIQGNLVGTFAVEEDGGARLMDCGGDGATGNSVTHETSLGKRFVRLVWKSPVEFQGNVFFRYSVAESFEKFWTNLESSGKVVVKRRPK